jgi:hypothetical protein
MYVCNYVCLRVYVGQVHTAVLNGKQLAIKIQRQGLKELFDMDLKNIKVLAKLLDKFDPKSDGAQRDWDSIYDESAKLLYKEIDYQAEALNCIRFKGNFANVPWVKVPEVSTHVCDCEYIYAYVYIYIFVCIYLYVVPGVGTHVCPQLFIYMCICMIISC